MSYQKHPSWCAPAAVQIALQIQGVRIGQARLAHLMNTTEDGTDEDEIIRALGELNYGIQEFKSRHRGDARSWLLELAPVMPLILCVDRWEHWVCVAGQCGDRLWLFDPELTGLNQNRNGAWALLPKTILKRWCTANRFSDDLGTLYYGIAILPR